MLRGFFAWNGTSRLNLQGTGGVWMNSPRFLFDSPAGATGCSLLQETSCA